MGMMAGAGRAQTPISREVSFKVPDLTLVGTFEAPAGSGKHPALLLLPGSGPTDRDGNSNLGITTNVLKQIADSLAAKGIASFRFDKRAIRHYQDTWPKSLDEMNRFFGWRKFVEDAEAALKVLRDQPGVDPARVGLLGHSEGALISLQVGSELKGSEAPKILILVSGTGRPMGPILHEQIERSLKRSGFADADVKADLDYTDSACKALAAGRPLPPNPPQVLRALFNPTVVDIMGAYCRIDPAVLAGQFAGPVLLVNGKNDTQVSAERDTPLLAAALKARSGGVLEVLIVPDASHCLKSTASGNMDQFDGPMVPSALDRITSFASAHL